LAVFRVDCIVNVISAILLFTNLAYEPNCAFFVVSEISNVHSFVVLACQVLISYISRRFSSDFPMVTSSANSRSLPTGIPMAMRVTFTPSGFIKRER
jgi:hypothetical protein